MKTQRLIISFLLFFGFLRGPGLAGAGADKPKTALFPVCLNSLCGYLDLTGRLVIAPKYDVAYPFNEGLAAVKTGARWGYTTRPCRV